VKPVGAEGLPLFDGHVGQLARATDPGTSKDAAALTLGSVIWQREQIVRALQYFWANGATTREIADFLNRESMDPAWVWDDVKVARRMHEVRAAFDCITYDNKDRPGMKKYQRVDREGCAIHVYARQGVPVGEPPECTERRQRELAMRIVA